MSAHQTAKAPAQAPAPVKAPASPEKKPDVSNAAVASTVKGGDGGGSGDGDANAPVTRTYTCTLGGTSFAVTCGEETGTVALSGFGGSFGHLQIEDLTASVKIGASGPAGRVRGSATVAGCVPCSVRGTFEGTTLKLEVSYSGGHPLWEGLELSHLDLRVGEAVSGGGTARFAIPGVEGTVALQWVDGRLVVHTTQAVQLPYLGVVGFQVAVDGFDFQFSADTGALQGLSVANALVEVTEGRIEAQGAQLVGEVSSRFQDVTGALSGQFDLSVAGPSQVGGSGTVTATIPGVAEAVTGTITAPPGSSPRISIPGISLSVADGLVSGTLDLSWSADEGLSFVPHEVRGTLPGGQELIVDFREIGYDAANGLTGTAVVPFDQLGIEWTAAPGVLGVSGEVTVALQNGELVAGLGVATVEFAFGRVDVQIAGFGEAGIDASLTATLVNLGPSVQLDQPLVIHGEHIGGVTTFQANGVAFAIDLGAADLSLKGQLGETVFSVEGLTSAADLALVGGPFGLGNAHAEIRDGTITEAVFAFPDPTFRYPPDAPAIEGQWSGELRYAEGRFQGEIAGDATIAGLGDDQQGTLTFQATATEAGGLEGMVQGADIETPLVVVDRFFLQIAGDQITSDIQVSTRDDLPFEMVGGVEAGWNEAGFYAQGGFGIRNKEGESPAINGSLTVGYDAENGLTASGRAEVVLDEDADARLNASLEYREGQLIVSAQAGVVAVANEPIIDFQMAFGGSKLEALMKKLHIPSVDVPLFGIPYLHGVVANFGLLAARPTFGGKFSGFRLSAGLKPFDVLGDAAPDITVEGGFENRSGISFGLGFGLQMKLIATVYGISIGVKGGADILAELVAVDPSFHSQMTWDPEGNVMGDLLVKVPMEFQLSPFSYFGVMAGISKLTVPIPGLGDKYKGDPFVTEVLDPLEFNFPWDALVGGKSATADLDPLGSDPNLEAIKKGVMDGNPKLASIIEFIMAATEIVGDIIGEFNVWIEGGTEFWSDILTGESLETSQRNQHHLERMLRENMDYAQEIKRHHENVRALVVGGPGRIPLDRYARELQLLQSDLIGIIVNIETMNGKFGADIEASVLQSYRDASRAVSARQMALLSR